MDKRAMTCMCGQFVELPDAQTDVKCLNCGRVFTHQGRLLWQEKAGNDLPGSSDIRPGGGDKRDEDEGNAIGEAFAAGKLPVKDRRPLDDGKDTAVKLGERLDKPPAKPSRR